mgnify:CR=1 FL=1
MIETADFFNIWHERTKLKAVKNNSKDEIKTFESRKRKRKKGIEH